MVIESKCLFIDASRVITNMDTPEADCIGVKHTMYGYTHNDPAEWLMDTVVKRTLIDQVILNVYVGDIRFTNTTNGGTTHADNRIFSCNIPFTAA